jgi:hypothetical protein
MKKSQLKEAIKAEIKSVLSEELEKFQMTYKGDPVHIKVQGFGGNEEGAKDTVLFVNVGGIGKRESKASENALEKRLGLLDKKVDKIMFTDKDNTSKEIKDISKDDFEIKSVLSENVNPAFDKKIANFAKKINNEMGYQGGVLEAMKQIKSRLERIISKVEGAKRGGADEEPLMKMIGLKEGTWSLGKASDINIILSQLQDLSKKAYNIIGDDEFYNGIDAAITRAEELMMNAPLNEDEEPTSTDLKEDRRRVVDYDNRDDRTTELFLDNGDSVEVDVIELYDNLKENNPTFADIREEDEMTDAEKKKAAEKDAKKEKIGKQASKLSQADEDRYERIKNGLEKLKKKGDEESIKRMKAILGKEDVQRLIKAKGRKEKSFM